MFRSGPVRLSIALVMLGYSAATVNAECIGFPFEHHVKYSDMVFRGVVTDVQRHDTHMVMTFQVSRVWKGKAGKTVVLHQIQGLDRATWPEDLVGREFLILASRLSEYDAKWVGAKASDVLFGVPNCLDSISISSAATQLKKLGRGRAPK